MKTKTNNFGTSKRGLALAIVEVYERYRVLDKKTFDAIMKRLESRTKETLLKYIEYIESHENPQTDAAFCIALGTRYFLSTK